MTEIRTRVLVDTDHRISGTAPAAVPPGEHEVTITVMPSVGAAQSFDFDTLPNRDVGPWPEGLSLRREDLYDEDGR